VPPWGTLCLPGGTLCLPGGTLCLPGGTLCLPGAPCASLEHPAPPWSTLCLPGAPCASLGHPVPHWGTLCLTGAPCASLGHPVPPWSTLCLPGAPCASLGQAVPLTLWSTLSVPSPRALLQFLPPSAHVRGLGEAHGVVAVTRMLEALWCRGPLSCGAAPPHKGPSGAGPGYSSPALCKGSEISLTGRFSHCPDPGVLDPRVFFVLLVVDLILVLVVFSPYHE